MGSFGSKDANKLPKACCILRLRCAVWTVSTEGMKEHKNQTLKNLSKTFVVHTCSQWIFFMLMFWTWAMLSYAPVANARCAANAKVIVCHSTMMCRLLSSTSILQLLRLRLGASQTSPNFIKYVKSFLALQAEYHWHTRQCTAHVCFSRWVLVAPFARC